MGSRDRARNITKKLCLRDEEKIEALKNCEAGQYVVEIIYSLFQKCGNCPTKLKCGTDFTEFIRQRSNLPEKLGLGDKSSTELFEVVEYTYSFLDEKLDREEKIEYIEGLLETSGIDPLEIIEGFDEVFGDCPRYNEFKLRIVEDYEVVEGEEGDGVVDYS